MQPPLPAGAVPGQGVGPVGFTQNHQRLLLQIMLTRPGFALRNQGVILPGHFGLESHRQIASWVIEFAGSNPHEHPTREYLEFQINGHGKCIQDVNLRQSWYSELHTCYATDSTGAPDVLDNYLTWCRDERVKAILYNALKTTDTPDRDLDIGEVCAKLKEAQDFIHQQTDLGVKLFGDPEATFEVMSAKYDRVVLPTGDREFDKNLSGGPGVGEMLLYVAPPKSGKTTRMLHDARLYAHAGFPGVFISGEQRTYNLARRLAEAVSQSVAANFKDTEQGREYWKIWSQWLTANYAPVYMKHMTRFGPDDVGRYIERCNADCGKQMRFAVVDYLNLMSGGRKYTDLRHELAAMARDLRAVFDDLNVVGITATQANRSSAEDELVYATAIAECFELVGIADVIVGIAQPEELMKKGVMNLFGGASRIGKGYWKLQYRTELSFGRLYAIEVGQAVAGPMVGLGGINPAQGNLPYQQ